MVGRQTDSVSRYYLVVGITVAMMIMTTSTRMTQHIAMQNFFCGDEENDNGNGKNKQTQYKMKTKATQM